MFNKADASGILDKSRQWVGALSTFIDGMTIHDSPSISLSAPLCYLSIRHFSAIVMLCEHNLYGSALSLLRAQHETYIRSVWLYHCATESELQAILGNKHFPHINEMLNALSNNRDFYNLKPDNDDAIMWKLMNDFTHGGVSQIGMHSHEGTIGENVTPEHIFCLLEKSSPLGLMAGVFMMSISNDVIICNKLIESYKSIFKLA